MLYMTGEQKTIIVLETGNLERLKEGKPAVSPDGKVCICWTPDPKWLAEQIMQSNGETEKIARAIEESTKRPENPTPPLEGMSEQDREAYRQHHFREEKTGD